MYSMLFERSHRVLMARVAGTFNFADLVGINDDAAIFVAREGSVRFLCDMSGVVTVDISNEQVVGRAQGSAVLPTEQRVYVAPSQLLFGLSRLFGLYQRQGGSREPSVVHTLTEAYRELDLVDPDFQPVDRPA